MTQHYELLYVIPGSVTDEDVPATKTKITDLVKTAGATLTQEQDLGRKKLAYRIGQHYQGVYQYAEFDADAAVMQNINNLMQLSQEVLRFLITQRDSEPAEIIAERAKLRESIQAKRQEKMAKEVGRAMAKAQEAKQQVAQKAAPATPTEMKDIEKELDKLMSDDVKV